MSRTRQNFAPCNAQERAEADRKLLRTADIAKKHSLIGMETGIGKGYIAPPDAQEKII
jgi:hypothetical protein